jgi:methylphosphotriester-DNA--protein-cysteine methyltransferase
MSSVGGYDLSPPRGTLSVTPPLAAMARLRRLHAAAVQLAETAPEIIANPDAASGLEQALGEAMASCLETGDPADMRVAHRHHAMVMRRLEEMLRAETEGPLYMADLCKAVGCSPQTLRACCREHLGMSPNVICCCGECTSRGERSAGQTPKRRR